MHGRWANALGWTTTGLVGAALAFLATLNQE